jgi:YD repeat-containing protein
MKTKYLLTAFALLITLSLTSATKADVNMKNASFLSHWLDMTIDGPTGSLEMRRFYNSRSARVGLFGFGWCSAYEKSLRILGDSVALSDCALEGEKPVTDIKRSPAGYNLQTDENALEFDKNGRLVKLKSKAGLEINLIYSKLNRLTQLQTSDGRKLDFIYDLRGSRVIEVKGSNGKKVKYQYSGDDLMAVITQKNQAKFTYDDAHNLIRIEHPEQQYEVVIYELTLDRVKKYRSTSGCIDTFDYKTVTNNNYVSSAERLCGDRIVNRATYRFIHNPAANTFQPIAREITGVGQ